MSGRVRGFCFTLNNWSEEEHSKLLKYFEKNAKIEKYIIGEEVGKKNGTPHLQGYIYYTNARSKNIVEKEIDLINRIWITKAKGNPKQNYIYCTKDGKYLLGGDWGNIIRKVETDPNIETENKKKLRQEFIEEMNKRYDQALCMKELVMNWINPEYKNMGWDSGYEDDDEDENYLDVKQWM